MPSATHQAPFALRQVPTWYNILLLAIVATASWNCKSRPENDGPAWRQAFPNQIEWLTPQFDLEISSEVLPERVMDLDSVSFARLPLSQEPIGLRLYYDSGLPCEKARIKYSGSQAQLLRIKAGETILAEGLKCREAFSTKKIESYSLDLFFSGKNGLSLSEVAVYFPSECDFPFEQQADEWQGQIQMLLSNDRVAQMIQGKGTWLPEGVAKRKRLVSTTFEYEEYNDEKDPFRLIEEGAQTLSLRMLEGQWTPAQIQKFDQAWAWLQRHQARPFPQQELRRLPATAIPPHVFPKGAQMIAWMMIHRAGMTQPGQGDLFPGGADQNGQELPRMLAPSLIPESTQKVFLLEQIRPSTSGHSFQEYFFLYYNRFGFVEDIIFFTAPHPIKRQMGYLNYRYNTQFEIVEVNTWTLTKEENPAASSARGNRFRWD